MVNERMFNEAVGAVRNGEINRARDLFTRLIKVDPRNVECWIWMSAVVDTPKERIYCLQEALKIDPTNQVARRGLVMAGALPPEGKPESIGPIRRNWQSALQADLEKKEPTNWRRIILLCVSGMLAVGLIILGIIGSRRVTPSMSQLKPAYTLRPSATYLPTNTPLMRTSSPTFIGPVPLWMQLKATYTPTALYVATPHPRTEAFRSGMYRFQAGDFNAAIPYFQQALTLEPGSPDILFYIGESYRLQGNTSEAMKTYVQAIQLDANFAPPYLARALLILKFNPNTDIRPDLKKAVTLDPGFAEAYLQLAALDLQDKQYQAVLDDAAQAEKTRPDSPWVFLYRAQAYLALNQPEKALQSAQKANQLDMTILISYRILAQALQANGNLSASLEPLQTYLLYQPEDDDAWVLLGKAYADQHDLTHAESAFTQAIKLGNISFDAFFGRGMIYLDQGEDQNALADLQTAYQLNKGSFAVCLNLGRAYTQVSQFNDAVTYFNLAEKIAASDADLAAVYYWRAVNLEAAGQPLLAINVWKKLLALPANAVPQEWANTAQKKISAANTPTATQTLTRTQTSTPSSTPTRTTTVTLTPTPAHTATH